MEEKKEEIKKEYEIKLLNGVTDYDMAKEIIELFIDKHIPISAKRAQNILDIAKSMVLDIANILYIN